jgi:hypothetical protein
VFTEPHSLKQREDGVAWALGTDAETLLLTGRDTAHGNTPADAEAVCRQVRCPVLVVHGDQDAVVPYQAAVALAGWTGAELVTLRGSGHTPTLRDPVRVNLLIRDFVERVAGRPRPPVTWTRPRSRRRRALFVCSPIGLGHVRRDLAIADELRRLRPDLEIDWLTQDPVTRVLAERGERVHPASRWLASESAHFEAEAGEHDLHAFQALRRMDEIMVANFHVFHDVVAEQAYDLWAVDEGWEIDQFLFDNPELKRRPTSGWPTSSGCSRWPTGVRPRRCWRRTSTPSGSSGSGAIPGCVTVRSSWATPATWSRRRSARVCRRCASSPGSATRSPGTSAGGLRPPTARSCGPSWDTDPTSGCAW